MNTPNQVQIPLEIRFMHIEANKKHKRIKEKKNARASVVRPLFHIQPIPTIVWHTETLQFQMEL